MLLVPENISNETYWLRNGQTVAGGYGSGYSLHQINYPIGLDVDEDGILFIADTNNHRIVRWKRNAKQGQIIAGRKEPGNRTDQLIEPLAVSIDRTNDCLIISEGRNRRIMRWSLAKTKQNDAKGELIISNIYSLGLAMDNEGLLYVSDYERHEVRRYGPEDGRDGMVVAGGNDQGDGLNQLYHPRQIFVDKDKSVFVSDCHNHRVMKWMKNATEGVVAAGGQGQGNSSIQLSSPSGIFVDRTGSLYVVDQENHRVMRWLKDAKEGDVILGGNGPGLESNQFDQPTSISFDDQGNLYVADYLNHRIQRFKIQ
jgi:sugar lactone lactonase YvrE